jgi:hypothetical protein
MTFDEAERATLAALADVLIPASAGFLSASQAGVAGDGLDQVLAVRPDLQPGLKQRLHSAQGRDPTDVIRGLRESDPVGFADLAELVAGAYFLNALVRAELGYHGQVPRSLDTADHLDEELLQSVIDRGPIYRPTPASKHHSCLFSFKPKQ